MAYWLLKTEPDIYSYDDIVKDKRTTWDGVTSPGGISNIKKTTKGDKVFIYHTGSEKQVVGVAEITSAPYLDPKANNPRLYVFDLKPVKKLKNPVTLEQIKADKRFSDSKIVREPRLSVQPMPENLWNLIIKMSGG